MNKYCPVCQEAIIYLKNSKTRKIVPVNADSVKWHDATFISGKHVSHFSTCTNVREFNEVRERPPEPCRSPNTMDVKEDG